MVHRLDISGIFAISEPKRPSVSLPVLDHLLLVDVDEELSAQAIAWALGIHEVMGQRNAFFLGRLRKEPRVLLGA